MKKFVSKDINQTIKFGAKLGRLISKGDIFALTGELGSGKTTLVKGIAKGLGVKDAKYVNSPSFLIVKEYENKIPLYHFDIYRLDDPSSLDTVGYKDYFYGDGVTVIEWADKIRELLPDDYLDIRLSVTGEKQREIELTARGTRYENLLGRL
jgi:tRNA threonylcarbamoyladenosine biosynthesis protein TsaE